MNDQTPNDRDHAARTAPSQPTYDPQHPAAAATSARASARRGQVLHPLDRLQPRPASWCGPSPGGCADRGAIPVDGASLDWTARRFSLLRRPRCWMIMIAALALYALALYGLLGVGVALLFVCVGVTRVLPQPATVYDPGPAAALPGRGCPMAGRGAAVAAIGERGGAGVTRAHRNIHRLLWPLLAVAVGLALLLALSVARPGQRAGSGAGHQACSMSVGYRAIQWNRDKRVYDCVLIAAIAVYIAGFIAISAWMSPPPDQLAWIDLRIRACGSCAFLMLTAILSIGPLARLDRRFLKLLYNRRHFGVLAFLVALAHALFMIQAPRPRRARRATRRARDWPTRQIHRLSLRAARPGRPAHHLPDGRDQSRHLARRPDAPVWKALHMGVYLAFGLVVLHVALGACSSTPRCDPAS